MHVWGYFKDRATEGERSEVLRMLEAVQAGDVLRGGDPAARVKRRLFRLAEKYREQYLLDSLYFSLGE